MASTADCSCSTTPLLAALQYYGHTTALLQAVWPYYKLSAATTIVLLQLLPLYYAVLCSTPLYYAALCSTTQNIEVSTSTTGTMGTMGTPIELP
jgi:hypothetical protein